VRDSSFSLTPKKYNFSTGLITSRSSAREPAQVDRTLTGDRRESSQKSRNKTVLIITFLSAP